jgi:hypothetical protein
MSDKKYIRIESHDQMGILVHVDYIAIDSIIRITFNAIQGYLMFTTNEVITISGPEPFQKRNKDGSPTDQVDFFVTTQTRNKEYIIKEKERIEQAMRLIDRSTISKEGYKDYLEYEKQQDKVKEFIEKKKKEEAEKQKQTETTPDLDAIRKSYTDPAATMHVVKEEKPTEEEMPLSVEPTKSEEPAQ